MWCVYSGNTKYSLVYCTDHKALFVEGPMVAACPRKFQKSIHPWIRSIKKVPCVVSCNALPCKNGMSFVVDRLDNQRIWEIEISNKYILFEYFDCFTNSGTDWVERSKLSTTRRLEWRGRSTCRCTLTGTQGTTTDSAPRKRSRRRP